MNSLLYLCPRDSVYAVLDRHNPAFAEWFELLGTDAVEVDDRAAYLAEGSHLKIRVRLASLPEGRVRAIADYLARAHRIGRDAALLEMIAFGGVTLCACLVYVCHDPEIGRRYFADRRAGSSGREGGDH